MDSHDPELVRIKQLAAELYDALARYQPREAQAHNQKERTFNGTAKIDRFAFITAPAERETLRITAEHPNWTAAQVAAAVRQHLNNATTDKGVRFYWKIARLDARKRALLPPERLTQGYAADLSRFCDDDEE